MNLTQTLLAGAIALAVATSAQAQGFPTKPIRVSILGVPLRLIDSARLERVGSAKLNS